MQYTLSISDRSTPVYEDRGFLAGKKVAVIKAIRGINNMSLKEAKELSEEFACHNVTVERRSDFGGNYDSEISANRESYLFDGIETLRGLGITVTQIANPTISLLKETAAVALEHDQIRLSIQLLQLVEEHS